MIGALTASFLNMLTKMLAPTSSSIPQTGPERARALLLVETVVWKAIPTDMLMISMNTAMQR